MIYLRITFRADGKRRTVLVRKLSRAGWYKRVDAEGADWQRETPNAIQEEMIMVSDGDLIKSVPLRLSRKYGTLLAADDPDLNNEVDND